MRKRTIIAIILVCGVGVMSVFRIFQAIQRRKGMKEEARKEERFTYSVRVRTARYKMVADSVNFIGEIRGVNEVTVVPKVIGRLIKKNKEEGTFVRKDEVIAEIDRDEPLLKYAVYELRSPIDGILGKYFVDVGAMVSQQTPVCIISEVSKVKLIFSVGENVVNKINKNSYVKFALEGGQVFTSSELQLSNYIDPGTRSMEVRVILDNAKGLFKSGSFVKGELIFYERYALTVPTEAILEADGRKVVYVVREDSTVEEREVKTGLKYKDFTEIIAGLKDGERVVYQGSEILTPGVRVEVVE